MRRFLVAIGLCIAGLMSSQAWGENSFRNAGLRMLAKSEVIATKDEPGRAGTIYRQVLAHCPTQPYPLILSTQAVVPRTADTEETVLLTIEMVASHALVELAEGATVADLRTFCLVNGYTLLHQVVDDLYVVSFPCTGIDSLSEALATMNASLVVKAAGHDPIMHATAVPNDPLYFRQWNMDIISAPAAWNRKVDSSNVAVGVIDTGIDYEHPDIQANMWKNPGEDYDINGNPGNNRNDDDGNGYRDDYYGWNFLTNNNDPMDLPGDDHGTHCAGVIGAVSDNSIGVAGVNWRTKLVALRAIPGPMSAIIPAIRYASNTAGIKLTSNSWGAWLWPFLTPPNPDSDLGGSVAIQKLSDEIAFANTKGKLFVCAAGNDTHNVDLPVNLLPYGPAWTYPPYLNQENMITVAATGPTDELSSYSNYSDTRVHIAAPGGEIDAQANQVFSTFPRESGGGYGYMAGTSMACPHVAGAAAMLHSLNPNAQSPQQQPLTGWYHLQVRARILGTADQLPSLFGYCDSYARLNLNRMLPATIPNYLRLLYPIGTERFVPGNSVTIRWVSNLGSGIKIDLYKDNVFHSAIAANVPTDATGQRDDDHGSYTWNIPLDHEAGGDFSIRLTALSGGLRDESFTKFSITGVNDQCYLTIMAYPKAGGTTDPVPGTYGPFDPGTEVDIEALPVAPYVFNRWFSTPNGALGAATDAATTVTVNGNTTVIAYFALDAGDALKLQVKRHRTEYGTTDPTGITYVAAGVPVDLIATPLVEPPHLYEFLRWDIINVNKPWDPNCVIADLYAAATTITCFKDTQVVARFYRTTNRLNVTSNIGGTVLPKGIHIVEIGTALPIETTLTDPTREFICWSHSANVTVADVTAMSTDATLEWIVSPLPPTNNPVSQEGWVRANYQPIGAKAALTMKSSPGTLGDVTNPDTGSTTLLAPHTVQAITADAAPSGHAFSHWTVVGDGVIADVDLTNPATDVTVHWNCTVTAHYVRTVQLDAAAVGPGTVTEPAAPPVNVNINEWVNLIATPDAGEAFIMWTATPGAVIDDPGLASTRVRLSANATVTAHFVATADLTNVCIGSTFTIAAADVPGLVGNFMSKPKVTARTYDTDMRVWRAVPISLVNFAMGDAVLTCRWTGLVPLFNRDLFLRYYQRRTINGSGGIGGDAAEFTGDGNLNPGLNFILHVQSREIPPTFLGQGVTLVPPVITSVETRNGDAIAAAHAGGILVVSGNYFGSKPPSVWLENEGVDTVIRQTRCRVLKPYAYPNHLGVANRSPMDPPTGASEVWVKIPSRLPVGWDHAAAHNLVLRNFHGMGDAAFGTIDPAVNTVPVANDDAFSVAVNSRGNVLDILANDEDAEADDVRIILGVTNNGGRISVVNRRVVYTPARDFPGVETFTYMLDDRHSDGMGIGGPATVTINVVP